MCFQDKCPSSSLYVANHQISWWIWMRGPIPFTRLDSPLALCWYMFTKKSHGKATLKLKISLKNWVCRIHFRPTRMVSTYLVQYNAPPFFSLQWDDARCYNGKCIPTTFIVILVTKIPNKHKISVARTTDLLTNHIWRKNCILISFQLHPLLRSAVFLFQLPNPLQYSNELWRVFV